MQTLSTGRTYMDECSSNQNTSTKVLAEEEDAWRDLHPLDFLRDNWKSTATNRGYEDDDCIVLDDRHSVCAKKPTNCGHVQGEIVLGTIFLTPTHWLLCGRHCGKKLLPEEDTREIDNKFSTELPAAWSPATTIERKKEEK